LIIDIVQTDAGTYDNLGSTELHNLLTGESADTDALVPQKSVSVYTYRQARLLCREGIGVGAGPPPPPDNSIPGKLPGSFVGSDADCPGIKIGFIPAKYLGLSKPALDNLEGHPLALYFREGHADRDASGGLDKATETLKTVIKEICKNEIDSLVRPFHRAGNLQHNLLR
jgi:hypothetical protein